MRDCEVTNIIPLAKTKTQQGRQITGLIQQMIIRANQNSKNNSRKSSHKAKKNSHKAKKNSHKAKKNSQKSKTKGKNK